MNAYLDFEVMNVLNVYTIARRVILMLLHVHIEYRITLTKYVTVIQSIQDRIAGRM